MELGAFPRRRRLQSLGVVLFAIGALTACAPLTPDHQPRISKPNMQFSEARSLNAPTRIASQLEPGRVVTGGAQASVCTTCR